MAESSGGRADGIGRPRTGQTAFMVVWSGMYFPGDVAQEPPEHSQRRSKAALRAVRGRGGGDKGNERDRDESLKSEVGSGKGHGSLKSEVGS